MEWLWLPHVRRLSAIKAPITAVTDLVENNLANLLVMVTLAIKVLLYVVVTAILLLREMNVSTRTDLSRQFSLQMLKRSRRAEAGLR